MRPSDWFLLIVLSLLWGGAFLFVEVALEGLPPLTLVWLRVAIAAVVLGLALPLFGVTLPPRHSWPALVVMGILNNAIPFTCFSVAQGQITGGLAAVLNATTPLMTVIVAHVATSDERITRRRGLALALGFVGVLVMMAGQVGGSRLAMALCLGAALSYALAGVWGRRLRPMGVAPLQAAFGQVLASTLLMIPVWLVWNWLAAAGWPVWPGGRVAGAVLALAVLSTALAYLIYFRLLARAGATNVALVTFLIPVSATGLGALLLGEDVLLQQVLGFVLIAAGLWSIQRRAA